MFGRNLFPTNSGGNGHTALIHLDGLSKSYYSEAGEFPALKGIDLEIKAGEFISIVGKSGSGKTTLINMIAGIDRPTDGEIWVGGTPVHTLSEGQMAVWRGRNIGIVFQFFQLLPTLSLLENVMLPMDFSKAYPARQRKERALHLLDLVGIADHAYKLPSAVSGGQQQRAAIARALANDPPLIVADEPTGNLDSRTAEDVFSLFERLVAQGKTFVIVTHDVGLAKRVHRSVVIRDGEIYKGPVAKAVLSGSNLDAIPAYQKL
jgi:ABC-type lipoprotein export system ATPase subunit